MGHKACPSQQIMVKNQDIQSLPSAIIEKSKLPQCNFIEREKKNKQKKKKISRSVIKVKRGMKDAGTLNAKQIILQDRYLY